MVIMTYDVLKEIGGFMRKASRIRCEINNGLSETIIDCYRVDGSEAVKKFSLLPSEEQFILIWKIVNKVLIEEPLSEIGYIGDRAEHCSNEEAFSLEEAKISFKGITAIIGGDDGAYVLCAMIALYWLG
jgi:hypothetical protein